MKRNRKAKEHSFTHFSFVFRSVGFTSTDRYMFQFWMWSVSKKKKSPQRRNRLHESHSLFYLWLSLVHTSLLRASEQAKCFWLLFFSHTQQFKKKKERKKLTISTSNQRRNLVHILLLSFFYSLKWVSATLLYPHLSGESRPQLFFSPNSCEYVSQISKTRAF